MEFGCRVGWESNDGTRKGTLGYGPNTQGQYMIEGDNGETALVCVDDIFPLDYYNLVFRAWDGKTHVERYRKEDYRDDEIRRLAIHRKYEQDSCRVMVKEGARWLVEF